MNITLSWDASTASAPAGFQTAIQYAASQLDAIIQNTAPGVLATSTTQQAYFSLDGGKTNLGNFSDFSSGSDPSGWALGTAPDDFDNYLNTGTQYPLTAVDKQELGAIGFNVGITAPSPPPTPPVSQPQTPPAAPPAPVIPPTPAPPMNFIVKDTTTGMEMDSNGTAYSGPVSYLKAHPSPHFVPDRNPPNSPLLTSISANRCISGSSRCSGMFGISS